MHENKDKKISRRMAMKLKPLIIQKRWALCKGLLLGEKKF
jgi:hypothetical protein